MSYSLRILPMLALLFLIGSEFQVFGSGTVITSISALLVRHSIIVGVFAKILRFVHVRFVNVNSMRTTGLCWVRSETILRLTYSKDVTLLGGIYFLKITE